MIRIFGRFSRTSKGLFFAALVLGSAAAAGHAMDLAPAVARRMKSGSIAALTSYTNEKDDFRVVATVPPDYAGGTNVYPSPMRFIATLAPGQTTIVSVPRYAGIEAIELKIARIGDLINGR